MPSLYLTHSAGILASIIVISWTPVNLIRMASQDGARTSQGRRSLCDAKATPSQINIGWNISNISDTSQIFAPSFHAWHFQAISSDVLRRRDTLSFFEIFLTLIRYLRRQQFFLDTLSQSLSHLELCHSEQRFRSELKPGRKVCKYLK